MFGEYPSVMRTRVGSRLPKFSSAESTLLKGSLDFVGINHYTTWYAKNSSIEKVLNDSLADSGALTLRMSLTFLLLNIILPHSMRINVLSVFSI